MSMNRHVILSFVDTPLKYLFWTKGEIALFLGPLFLGMILNQVTLGIIISALNAWGSRKYKRQFGRGKLEAVKYWYFPSSRIFKGIPASHIREYIG